MYNNYKSKDDIAYEEYVRKYSGMGIPLMGREEFIIYHNYQNPNHNDDRPDLAGD